MGLCGVLEVTATHVICVRLGLRIESVANLREHHMARARRAALHKHTARYAMANHKVSDTAPLTITLTRIAPRELDSHDNLRSGLKNVADGIALWLGVADNHPSLTWKYAQRKGKPKEYDCEVTVEWPA
jgi:hypothetical protein